MSSAVNDNPQSNLYQSDAYTLQLTQRADEAQVALGPGGASVIVDRDSMVGVPPSQQGISRSDVFKMLASDPLLLRPVLARLAEEIRFERAHPDEVLGGALIKYAYAFFGIDLQTSLSKLEGTSEERSSIEEELEFIRNAQGEFQKESQGELSEFANSSGGPGMAAPEASTATPGMEDPLDALFSKLQQMSSDVGSISEENSAILKSMSSQDPEEVSAMLLEQAGIAADTDLTPEMLTMLQAQFSQLGGAIAAANGQGGAPVLSLTLQPLITIAFAKTLDVVNNKSLSPEQQDLLTSRLYTAAGKVADANTAAITTRQPASEEFTQMTSSDPAVVNSALTSLYAGVDLSKLSPEERTELAQCIANLSTSIANKSFDETTSLQLLSNNPDVMSRALASIIQTMPPTSPLVQYMLTTAILPAIAQNGAKINETELSEMLKSGNAKDIETALGVMSGVSTEAVGAPVHPQAKKIVNDYLKALTEALAFMSQIRAMITRLEGSFTQELAAAKMASISDQVKNAMSTYLAKTQEIEKTQKANLDKIHSAQVMKYLMPIISVLLIVAAIVVLAASLVAAIPSGGISAVAGVAAFAQIIALVVAISVTSAVLIYTVVDTASTWVTGKGILEHAFENVKDETLKKALMTGVNVAIIAVTAVLTLGVGIGSAIAIGVSQGVQISIRAILQTILELLKSSVREMFRGPLALQMIGLIVGAVMSHGFVTDLFIKLFKLMKCSDKDSMIAAAAIQMILTLAIMLATAGREIRGGFVNAAAGIKQMVEKAASGIKDVLTEGITSSLIQMFSRMKDALKTTLSSLGERIKKLFDVTKGLSEGIMSTAKSVVESAVETSISIAEKILKRFIENLKNDPLISATLLDFFAGGLQVAANAVQMSSSKMQAEINTQLAKLEREVSALEAVASFMRSCGAISHKATIQSLGESADRMFNQWKELCNMVAQFITGASQRTSELYNRAG